MRPLTKIGGSVADLAVDDKTISFLLFRPVSPEADSCEVVTGCRGRLLDRTRLLDRAFGEPAGRLTSDEVR